MKKLINSLAFVFFATCTHNPSLQAFDLTTAGIVLSVGGGGWSYVSVMNAISPFPVAYKKHLQRGLIATGAGLLALLYSASQNINFV